MRLSAIRRQGGNSSRTIGKLEQVLALIRTGCLSKAGGGSAKRAVGTNSEAGTCARSEDKTSREFTRAWCSWRRSAAPHLFTKGRIID
jgi:hypothetical protein